ncbi:MAG: all3515 family Zur-repressed PEP-CTERM protein [Fimbriimonadaceae bacterium]
MWNPYRAIAIAGAASLAAGAFPFAIGQTNWFIGVDGLQNIPSGAYAGLPNPNFGRLTFLYGHQYDGIDDGSIGPASSHFHSKSRWAYSGPASNPTIVDAVTTNFVPEDGTRITLLPGSGPTAGLFVSGLQGTDVKWANPRHSSVAWLNRSGAETWETFLFNSSAGRWSGSLGAARVALQIVSITPGLSVWAPDFSRQIDQPGQFLELGVGDSLDITPVFAAGALGSYNATFRLLDLHREDGYRPLLDSGRYEMRFEAVPEPATMLALGAGVAALALRRRQRKVS